MSLFKTSSKSFFSDGDAFKFVQRRSNDYLNNCESKVIKLKGRSSGISTGMQATDKTAVLLEIIANCIID